MADISKIVTLDGSEYDIKDAIARRPATTSYAGLMSAEDKAKIDTLDNPVRATQQDIDSLFT